MISSIVGLGQSIPVEQMRSRLEDPLPRLVFAVLRILHCAALQGEPMNSIQKDDVEHLLL
jgi:hypothetical protein